MSNLILQFEPEITKELILQHTSEENLMEHYLGITPKKGLFKSPLRTDDSATCSFHRKNGNLIFKDFRGDFYGNFIDVVMYKYSCDYYKALQIIANDLGIKKNDKIFKNEKLINYSDTKLEEKKATIIQVEIQDFTKAELLWWKSFGISEETLKIFNIFSCKHVFLNNNYFTSSSKNNYIFGFYHGKNKEGLEN